MCSWFCEAKNILVATPSRWLQETKKLYAVYRTSERQQITKAWRGTFLLYIFIIGILKPKIYFFRNKRIQFLWILLCEAIVLILFYVRVITKCLKVVSVYLPTGLFYSQDSGAENGKQRAKSRCLVTLPIRTWRMLMYSNQSKLDQKNRSRSTCKHGCWKKKYRSFVYNHLK